MKVNLYVDLQEIRTIEWVNASGLLYQFLNDRKGISSSRSKPEIKSLWLVSQRLHILLHGKKWATSRKSIS